MQRPSMAHPAAPPCRSFEKTTLGRGAAASLVGVTRPRALRWWAAALWGLLLLATVSAEARSADHPDRQPPAAVAAILAGIPHVAPLPARLPGDVRVTAQAGGSSRALVLATVLAALLGLPARYPGHDSMGERGRRPRQVRRYAIARRAPPLLRLA